MVSAHDAPDILHKWWIAGLRAAGAGLRAARPAICTATPVVHEHCGVEKERHFAVDRFDEQNVCGRNVLLVLVRSNVLVLLACYTCL